MAQTYVYGTMASSDMVGIPESVSPGMAKLMNIDTPLLAVCSPSLNNLVKPCTNVTHSYFEKQWRPMRTTLGSALSSSATSVTFSDQAFKPGELVLIDLEVIKLTSTSDFLTFVCERSVGAAAAAAHSSGASCVGAGKAWVEGAASSTGDMVVKPNQVTNYARIYRRTIAVSGTSQVLEEYHRDGISSYDYAVKEHEINVLQEMDNDLFQGVAQARSGSSTEGRADGILERIYSTGATSLSGLAPNRQDIRTVLDGISDYAGTSQSAKALFCDHYIKGIIDDWNLPYQRHEAGSPMAQVFGSNVKRLELGGYMVDVIASAKFKSRVLILSPEFIRVGPLTGPGGSREFKHRFDGPNGDTLQGLLVGEYTFEVGAPLAHGVLYNVATS